MAFTDILRPTPGDMQLLAKHKYFVVQHWIDHAVAAGLTPYKDTDDQWEPTAFDWIWAKSQDFNLATISLDKYYVSPTMMRLNGYDSWRNKPELLDDELYIESHMTIGKGEDFDSRNAEILWFCAANHLPSS